MQRNEPMDIYFYRDGSGRGLPVDQDAPVGASFTSDAPFRPASRSELGSGAGIALTGYTPEANPSPDSEAPHRLRERIPLAPVIPEDLRDENAFFRSIRELTHSDPARATNAVRALENWRGEGITSAAQRQAKAEEALSRMQTAWARNQNSLPQIDQEIAGQRAAIEATEHELARSAHEFHQQMTVGGYPATEISENGLIEAIRRRVMPPTKPLKGSGARAALAGEIAATILAVAVCGPITGAAMAVLTVGMQVQDLIGFHSVIGNCFLFLIGPSLLLLAGEGYKKVVFDLVSLDHPTEAKTRHATIALWSMLAYLLVYSLADIFATAHLFQQMAAETSDDPWQAGPPLAMYLIEGVLVTAPIIVGKVLIGRHNALKGIAENAAFEAAAKAEKLIGDEVAVVRSYNPSIVQASSTRLKHAASETTLRHQRQQYQERLDERAAMLADEYLTSDERQSLAQLDGQITAAIAETHALLRKSR